MLEGLSWRSIWRGRILSRGRRSGSALSRKRPCLSRECFQRFDLRLLCFRCRMPQFQMCALDALISQLSFGQPCHCVALNSATTECPASRLFFAASKPNDLVHCFQIYKALAMIYVYLLRMPRARSYSMGSPTYGLLISSMPKQSSPGNSSSFLSHIMTTTPTILKLVEH